MGERTTHHEHRHLVRHLARFSRRHRPALAPAAATWDIDTSHANAGFRVRHLMVSHVRGQLGPVTGTAFIDQRDLTKSRLDVSVDVRGIDTRDPKRDEHLRSADFFDVAAPPDGDLPVDARRGAVGRPRATSASPAT